jgi:excisionase family DNA binding protein
MPKNAEKKYYTAKELADILGVSRVTVFNRIKQGKIKAEKAGRNYIIYKRDALPLTRGELDSRTRQTIEDGVSTVLRDYGDVIKRLGEE